MHVLQKRHLHCANVAKKIWEKWKKKLLWNSFQTPGLTPFILRERSDSLKSELCSSLNVGLIGITNDKQLSFPAENHVSQLYKTTLSRKKWDFKKENCVCL